MASIAGLVPKIKGQSDYTWDNEMKPLLRSPDKYSLEELISKLEGNITSWDDERRDMERRQCIWILTLLLFRYGWNTTDNRERVIDLVNEWDIDEAIFYEMKDTAEAYKTLADYQTNAGSDYRISEGLKTSKHDLDESIKNLIELG